LIRFIARDEFRFFFAFDTIKTDEETFQLSRLRNTPKSRMHLDALPQLSDHLCHEIITTPILTVNHLSNGFFVEARPSISSQTVNGSFTAHNRFVSTSLSSLEVNYTDSRTTASIVTGEELAATAQPWVTVKGRDSYDSLLTDKHLNVNSIASRYREESVDGIHDEKEASILLRRTGSRSNSPSYFRHGIRNANAK
jgi:hypothetical protein